MNATSAEAQKKRKPPSRPKLSTLSTSGTSPARRIAAVILEVLAGGRTPSDAAAALSTSLPRYYALEAKALAGLVSACEPTPPGKRRSKDSEISAMKRELDRARREAARCQALVRASQRTIGLAPPTPKPPRKGKRRRRPVVRALKAVQAIQSVPPTTTTVTEPSTL